MVTIPRWLARAVVLAASLALAAALPSPARAGFGVGPSSPIDPVRFAAVGDQDQVAAADNGSVTLFAWRDTRHGNADLWAARVNHAGQVLDPNGIELAATSGLEGEPSVAWDGAHWLVAWTEVNAGLGAVHALRVGTDGQPADPSPLTLSTGGANDASHPRVAWNGALFIVVWQEVKGSAGSVMGATIDPGGNVRAAAASLTAFTTDTEPAIAALGANALVAFVSHRSGANLVYGFRVTAALPGGVITRLDASDLALAGDPTEQAQPDVAASGANWLVSWEDARNRPTSSLDVFGARVSGAGALLDANAIAIATAAGAEQSPKATWDGTQWLVTWRSDAGQLARIVAANGNTPGGVASVSATHPLDAHAAWGGDPAHAIVAWPEKTADGDDVRGRRIETGLSFGLAFPLATQTPNQTQPVQAFGAGHWMLAWVDDRFGADARQIRVGLTDSAKFEAPNPATVAFAVPRAGLDQAHPALVYDGTNFNLFWDESRGGHLAVMAARFTAGGAFIDTFVVAGGAWNQYEPTAATFSDGSVSVVWTDSRAGATERDIWIRSFVNGAEQFPERQVAGQVGVREEHPSAANLNDDATMVVYETSTGGLDRAIESTSMERNLIVASPNRIVVIVGVGHTYQHPVVAGNGQDVLLAFEEVVFSDGPALHKPFVERYDTNQGQWFFNRSPGDAGSYTPANPIVGSAGYDFVAMWSTLTGGGPDAVVNAVDPYGDPVDPANPGPIRLTSDPMVDSPGAVAQGQGDRVGLTFVRSLDDASWNGLQLFGGDARDTITGQVVINEFLAHPASDANEFVEFYNTSGRNFFLNGWHLLVDGSPDSVVDCSIIFLDRKRASTGPSTEGEPCGTIDSHLFLVDDQFPGRTPDPVQGFLPDRGGVLQLVSPGGVVVDEVGYGFKGGAPVSGAIPVAIAPAAKTGGGPAAFGAGDSLSLATARLPNGTDTGNDASDFNLTGTSTPNNANTGTTAALGTALFVTRAYWLPTAAQAVVEFYNPSTSRDFDFSNWYLSNNNATERIGIVGNAWSDLKPQDKRILRGGERGSFTFHLDELSVLYLLGPDLTRYEQLGWSRPDNLTPDMCVTRVPDTGGFHDGFDWFSCGGQEDINSGEVRYTTCSIEAPAVDVPGGPVANRLSFAGAWPNPARAGQASTLVFTLPGATGSAAVHATLALYDVAGRRVSTLVDALLAPGQQRVPLTGAGAGQGRVLRSGTYYAELTVGGQKLKRTIVLLP